MIKESWKEQGFIDEPIAEQIDILTEIRRMCKEKNAVILAHYYTDRSLQEIAEACGFCCASHLNSRFKKAFGYSPSTFRYRAPR